MDSNLIDPADAIAGETLAQLAAAIDCSQPATLIEVAMESEDYAWDQVDPGVLNALDEVALSIFDHPAATRGMTRAGYRLGRHLLGDHRHHVPPPDLQLPVEIILSIDEFGLLDYLPPKAAGLTLDLSEKMIRSSGWWNGPVEDTDLEPTSWPDQLAELHGASTLAADMGLIAALMEHDLVNRQGSVRADDSARRPG